MTKQGGQSTHSYSLADWRNDDLLLSEEARQIVAAAAPRAFRVLDWPEVCETFERYDALANRAKKQVNRHGGRGALFGAIGASLISLAALIPVRIIENIIVGVGCLFVFVGGVMAVGHLIGKRRRAQWLMNRLWTERLRQFYFQFVINNFDAAIAAMNGDADLDAYKSRRHGAFVAFIDETEKNLSARGVTEAIDWLADDHEDSRVWADSNWKEKRVALRPAGADERELLVCLSRGRIGIQEVYARLNLKPIGSSQGNLARRIAMYGNIATGAFISSLTLAGVLIVLGGELENWFADLLIAASGAAAAWGLYFRLVDQGMGYSLDAERFELYFEQVGLVRRSFDTAADDVPGKIEALRQLEIYSYREMRQFLRTHLRSRFLG